MMSNLSREYVLHHISLVAYVDNPLTTPRVVQATARCVPACRSCAMALRYAPILMRMPSVANDSGGFLAIHVRDRVAEPGDEEDRCI